MEGSALVVSIIGIFITVIIEALYFGYKMGVIAKSISILEQKQDKHNSLIERTYVNEKEISVLKEQLSVENHRIADLEGAQNEYFRNRY
jgi:hypothetical protein